MRRHQRSKRKPMAEINVVPYIDVMLVLLVIFMVTAPLLYQGVDVDLPQAEAEPVSQDSEDPVIVTVSDNGELRASIGADPDETLSEDELADMVTKVMRNNPETPVLVRGDAAVRYGRVLETMTLLQQAGVPQVGMMTRPPEDD
ncbi:MAG: protein TolR [Ectothiorhodospiraceae bacterium]